MEAHERITVLVVKLALYGFLVHILRYGIVYIKKCYDIITYAGSDKL